MAKKQEHSFKYHRITDWLKSYEKKTLEIWYKHHESLGKKVAIYEKIAWGMPLRAVYVEGMEFQESFTEDFILPDYKHIKGCEFTVKEDRLRKDKHGQT